MRVTERILNKYANNDRYEVFVRGNECVILDKLGAHYHEQHLRTVESMENGDPIHEIVDMNKALDDMSKIVWA